MRLDALLESAALAAVTPYTVLGDAGSAEIIDITVDSRSARPGSLFCCLPGLADDGHRFAPAAVAAGAVAVVAEHPLPVPVPQVVLRPARAAVGPMAAALHGWPSSRLDVIGVTGTNGKTTTCALVAGILTGAGCPTAVIGTLTGARTTPEAPELQRLLADHAASGGRAVALEVSSHALVQHRVDGTRFAVAVFTNLTQDHLDYHGTMERYFEAKSRLFEADRAAVAVVNGDDPWGRRLLDRLEARSHGPDVVRFGLADAVDLQLGPTGSTFRWGRSRVRLGLGGRFNVANALAAASASRVLGIDDAAVAAGLSAARPVRGRFEPVEAGQDFTVLVDYAHTPDGLRQALTAARELADRHVIVVFGCGGDRDRAKRPLMTAVATELADLVLLTSDNPRGEDPLSIMAEARKGDGGPGRLVEEADREAAIATALAGAGPGDVVVIAGKGHETGQEVSGTVTPFDDAEVARRLLLGPAERR